MDPLLATAEALDLLTAAGDEDARRRVAWICETVADVVPHAAAVAVWFIDEDLTLVLVKPEDRGPRNVSDLAMRSSLALRFATDRRDIAVVTIYSERAQAFDGRVGVIERVHGAVDGESVLDDDLAFDAARRAELAPAQLRAQLVVDSAVGLLVGTHGLSPDEAEDWLDHVARTSGRTALDVATTIVAAHHADHSAPGAPPRRRESSFVRTPFVLCRIAHQARDQDPPTRDRRLKDFPAETMVIAERNARRWAADRNSERTAADRSRWPWVLERWNPADLSWEFVSHLV